MAEGGTVAVKQVDGDMAAAILLTLLDEPEAAAIVATFAPEQMRRVGTAMLGVAKASAVEIETALDLFVARSRESSSLGLDAEPRVRSLFTTAVGNVRADNLLATIAPQGSAGVLDRLRWMPVPALTIALRDEHPQVGALILACLTPETAAQCLESLDDERQCDLLYRSARLDQVNPAALADLELVLDAHAGAPAALPQVELGGRGGTAKIVTRLPRETNQRLLKGLKKRDKELAQAIEDNLLVFDDLAVLDAKNMGALLRTVDTPVLTLALRGADAATVERMLGCLSARAAESIRDEMEEGAPVKRSEVEEAQRQICGIARRLADEGELMLGSQGDDYV